MRSIPDDAPAAHIDLGEALTLLPGTSEKRFATALRHGTLSVELYGPEGGESADRLDSRAPEPDR
jgi:hypothetical protein